MVRSVERYPSETIVVVHAKLRKAPKPVKNATVHDYELEVYEIHKLATLTENVPFTVYDAENINRDKEDAEDEVDDAEEETPADTPRQSEEWSRLAKDNLLSRSMFLPTPNHICSKFPISMLTIQLKAVWTSHPTGQENLGHYRSEYD
jgi:aspartyl-tRNA synthetase